MSEDQALDAFIAADDLLTERTSHTSSPRKLARYLREYDAEVNRIMQEYPDAIEDV